METRNIQISLETPVIMETRNIQISLETATRWFNGTDKELKDLALRTFPELIKKELPESWKELGKISGWFLNDDSSMHVSEVKTFPGNRNIFATQEQAEASIALAQLSQLIKVYNGGWVPNWENEDELKYCIMFEKNATYCYAERCSSRFLSFKDKETAELFLEKFHKLIEIAKPLL